MCMQSKNLYDNKCLKILNGFFFLYGNYNMVLCSNIFLRNFIVLNATFKCYFNYSKNKTNNTTAVQRVNFSFFFLS